MRYGFAGKATGEQLAGRVGDLVPRRIRGDEGLELAGASKVYNWIVRIIAHPTAASRCARLLLVVNSLDKESTENALMDWGLKNRIAKIIKPADGRTVMLAVDHGYFLGPTRRLEEPAKTIEPLAPLADALMLTRGVLRSSVAAELATPIVLRVSGGASVIGPTLTNESIVTSMREAIRLNAVGVALSIFVGTDLEHESLRNLAHLIDEANDYGIPVLAVTAVGKELEKRDVRYLSLCCRIAAELGAHIVKTYYCEEFETVARGCPVPLVIAGGPKLNTELDALEITQKAIQQGAVGVDMGRNIWQSDWPVPMIKAIREVVHGGATAAQALELFNSLKREDAALIAAKV